MENSKLSIYYKILGISEGAPASEIRSHYLALCKKYHPDKLHNESAEKQKEAEEHFRLINEAYEILSSINKAGFDYKTKPDTSDMDARDIGRAYFIKGIHFYKEGDINNALDAFVNAYRKDESKPEYIRYIVKCLLTKERRLHEAKEYCLKLLKIEFYNSENYYLMGLIYKKANLTEAASEYFYKAKRMGFDSNLVDIQINEIEPKSFKKKIKKIFKKTT
ncbi:J domain-containing protein [Flexistipes sp.]|uniref:J domain-containing protein n=1 Tax=Flexistipes sp. TaxID=3088135 RepID=UPI002E1B7DA3|nr:J domain-containing protein [Flexistipes sp.]